MPFVLAFLSGFAALVLELSWSRQVGVLLGHTVNSASVVLTSMFLGMALGYLVGAKLTAKYCSLRTYGIAEVFVGTWTFIVPLLLRFVERFIETGDPATAGRELLLWVVVMAVLLPGTIAMGATLPLLTSSLKPGHSSRSLTSIYAVNTAGAFAGVVVASFWLLITAGITGASQIAGLQLIMVGLIALTLSYSGQKTRWKNEEQTGSNRSYFSSIELIVLAGVSGFGVLALETYYIRLFSLVLHNSTYTFSAVLAVTLLSLALGARLAGLIDKPNRRRSALVIISAIGAVSVPLSPVVFIRCTGLEYFTFGETFASYMLGVFGLMILVMGVPLVVLGMLLPLVWSEFLELHGHHVPKTVGVVTSVNAVGAAIGSALTSLVMLPQLGLTATALVIALPYATYAGLKLVSRHRMLSTLFIGMFVVVGCLFQLVMEDNLSWQIKPDESLLKRWESRYGLIDVIKSAEGVLKVRQNLHYRYGSTGHESSRAYKQSRLPLLLHGNPQEVLFLGLGSGLTAGGAVDFPGVRQATIVELIPEVIEAARLLSSSNYGVVDDPRFKMQVGDARHFLSTQSTSFDVIVSDLFVPWESETGYLYTVEHYERAKSRLKQNGLFCQWIPLYQLGSFEFEVIADSFAKVFPDVSLWWGNIDSRRPIVALVGSMKLKQPDEAKIQTALGQLYEKRPVDQSLRSIADIQSLYLGNWGLRRGTPLNTDEHPLIEFTTPASQMSNRLLKNESFLRYYDEVLSKLPDSHPLLFPGFKEVRAAEKQRHRLQLSR